jgi:hypothetical protein
MLLLPLDQVAQRAAALAAAMDAAGPIRINGHTVVVPRERLREAFGLQLETLLGGLARRVASRVGCGAGPRRLGCGAQLRALQRQARPPPLRPRSVPRPPTRRPPAFDPVRAGRQQGPARLPAAAVRAGGGGAGLPVSGAEPAGQPVL